MYPSHENDVYGWAVHTAQLLREKKMSEVDFDSVIEEMEALGRSEKHEFQPNMRGHSWKYTIEEQREQAKIHWEDNPSLKNKLNEIIARAYKIALSKAARETSLDKKTFPSECPYAFEQIMNDEFYPA